MIFQEFALNVFCYDAFDLFNLTFPLLLTVGVPPPARPSAHPSISINVCLCGAARSLYAKANIAGTLGKAALLADCCSLNAGAGKVVAAATATATATTAAAVSAGDDGGDGDGSVKGGVPQMQETCWRPHPMPLFRTSEAALISSSPSSSGDAADAADAEGGRVPDSEGGVAGR